MRCCLHNNYKILLVATQEEIQSGQVFVSVVARLSDLLYQFNAAEGPERSRPVYLKFLTAIQQRSCRGWGLSIFFIVSTSNGGKRL